MTKKAAAKGLVLAAAAAGLLGTTGVQAAVEERDGQQGRCYGANSCKGRGECRSVSNECAGKNSCRAKGFRSMTRGQCDEFSGEFQPISDK